MCDPNSEGCDSPAEGGGKQRREKFGCRVLGGEEAVGVYTPLEIWLVEKIFRTLGCTFLGAWKTWSYRPHGPKNAPKGLLFFAKKLVFVTTGLKEDN